MISALLNIPRTPADWTIWSFHHFQDHIEINQGIQTALGTIFADPQLDPINILDIENWLERNQIAHNEMNGSLGLNSTDLQRVDLADEKQKSAWILLHFQEHFSARTALRI